VVHLARRVAAILGGPGRASALGAVIGVLLLGLAALPASAGNGPTDLTAPSVSPTSGTTQTSIAFAVTYHSAKGSAPDYVRVIVGSTTYSMQKTAGPESWKNGVRYTTTRKLPAGTWTVRFEAKSGNFTATVAGPTVTITKAPKPTPEPTPKPTPKPTAEPRSTPKPTPKPTPMPTPAPTPTSTPTPTPTPTPSAAPTVPAWHFEPLPSGSPDPLVAGLVTGAGNGGSGTGGSGGNGPGGTGGSGSGGSGSGGTDAGLPGASSSLAATLVRVLPPVVVTTGGVTMLMAFLAFGKRRRDEEPTAPDDVLGDAAARGLGLPGHSGLVPAASPAAALAAVQALTTAPSTAFAPDDDAHLPRWRRPSLMEARKADPLRTVSTTVRLSFDGEVGEAVSGLERRLIRYRLVSLLDAPDEVRGVEIGVLDEGDEVVLLEKRGTYWRILCPDGRQGWLHKMTLGDTVIESGAAGASSWTSGDDGPVAGSFEDMLRAYTERRQQFGEAS
jgi:uncharacterized membrane protein YgcG